MRKTITLRRVIYGKKKTPLKDREYVLKSGGPVGTRKEWRFMARSSNVNVKFLENTKRRKKK